MTDWTPDPAMTPAGYIDRAPDARTCGECAYFSGKVYGPDGPHRGKCFLAFDTPPKGLKFYVSALGSCPGWKAMEATP